MLCRLFIENPWIYCIVGISRLYSFYFIFGCPNKLNFCVYTNAQILNFEFFHSNWYKLSYKRPSRMYYVPKDWELSQDPAEPFRFVLPLILSKLRPFKEVSFFSVQSLFTKVLFVTKYLVSDLSQRRKFYVLCLKKLDLLNFVRGKIISIPSLDTLEQSPAGSKKFWLLTTPIDKVINF